MLADDARDEAVVDMFDFGVDALTEVCGIVLIVAAITLACTTELRAGVMIAVCADTVMGVMSESGVDVLVVLDANTGGATMIALESTPMPTCSEEAFGFGCEACNCWPIIMWGCRALQA